MILHYNGRTWSRVAEGNFGYGPPAQQASPDGHGGLWLPMPDIGTEPWYFVHYSAGKLTAVALPARALVVSVSPIRGTQSALAAGYVYADRNPNFSQAAVILQYG